MKTSLLLSCLLFSSLAGVSSQVPLQVHDARFDARLYQPDAARFRADSATARSRAVIPDSLARPTHWVKGAKIGVGTGIVGGVLFAASYQGDKISFGNRVAGAVGASVIFGLVLGVVGGLIGSMFPK